MTLAAVVPLNAPLEQLPGETEREHLAFVAWCTARRRSTPHDPATAQRNRWSERALAYDAAKAEPEGEAWTATEQRFRRIVGREVRKLERASNVTDVAVPIPRDLVAAFMAMRGVPDAVPEVTIPVEDMTTEELRAIEQADRILARVGGKR